MWNSGQITLRPGLVALVLTVLGAAPAPAQVSDDPGRPLSAIEWLSNTIRTAPQPAPAPPSAAIPPAATPPAAPQPPGGPFPPQGPPVEVAPDDTPANGAEPEGTEPVGAETPIEVTPLQPIRKDAVGLLPPAVSGLPRDFWGPSPARGLAGLIAAQPDQPLPALQDLLYRILLAELDAPGSAETGEGGADGPATDSPAPAPDGTLLLARVDRLIRLGALDPAHALLERAGPTTGPSGPALFRRWFDISLLMGHADHACATLKANPGLAPDLKARVFCLARNGDWNAAVVTLATGERLGFIVREDADLLARFLDPELYADQPEPPVPDPLTPLDFVMREALALPRPAGALPLAYVHADLREGTPWRSRLQAAERLARSGALPAQTLIALYTQRKPAASGGIWDRVRAVTDFDVAVLAGDGAAVAQTLPAAWAAMESVALEVPFARHYAERLLNLQIPDPPPELARLLLLSDVYERAARRLKPADPQLAFAAALALGAPAGLDPPALPGADRAAGQAIAAAFLEKLPDSPLTVLLSEGRLGEAILKAMLLLKEGSLADPGDIRAALALFRAVGLEDIARRTAIQLVLLERRG